MDGSSNLPISTNFYNYSFIYNILLYYKNNKNGKIIHKINHNNNKIITTMYYNKKGELDGQYIEYDHNYKLSVIKHYKEGEIRW